VEIPRSRNWIVFNGTAAQVESALHSEVRSLHGERKDVFTRIRLSLPCLPHWQVSFLGFRGLNNFPREATRAQEHQHPRSSRTSPPVFSGAHFISPGDFATIYDLKTPLQQQSPRSMALGRKL